VTGLRGAQHHAPDDILSTSLQRLAETTKILLEAIYRWAGV
jgi:hypothetical protein